MGNLKELQKRQNVERFGIAAREVILSIEQLIEAVEVSFKESAIKKLQKIHKEARKKRLK